MRHAKDSRPPKPDSIPFGPPTQIHDRVLVIEERRKAAEEAKTAGASKGTARTAAWDEDDVMLFFWGNLRVATERHHKMREAERENLEQRQGLPAH